MWIPPGTASSRTRRRGCRTSVATRGSSPSSRPHSARVYQHLPDIVGHDGHGGLPSGFGRHHVRVSGTGALSRILDGRDGRDGEVWLDVPTHHHQAIDKIGAGLIAVAWAADGTVEAIEAAPQDGRDAFAIGVQWHPEEGDDPRLFEALAGAAG